jgi:hypothetical protein
VSGEEGDRSAWLLPSQARFYHRKLTGFTKKKALMRNDSSRRNVPQTVSSAPSPFVRSILVPRLRVFPSQSRVAVPHAGTTDSNRFSNPTYFSRPTIGQQTLNAVLLRASDWRFDLRGHRSAKRGAFLNRRIATRTPS